jgi:hypothetical protein
MNLIEYIAIVFCEYILRFEMYVLPGFPVPVMSMTLGIKCLIPTELKMCRNPRKSSDMTKCLIFLMALYV